MATENTTTGGETSFSPVSRVRGTVFEYATLLASVFGIAALAVLLSYVFWDAFGMESAEPAWYGAFALTVVVPVAAFVVYARRNALAGEVALELVSTTMAGVLGGLGLVVVFEIIAGPDIWFAYFLTLVAPVALLALYGRARPEVIWTGLAILGVVVAGPIVGTLFLDPLRQFGALLGPSVVYFVSLVVPAAAVVRYVVGDYLELWDGDYAAVAMVAAAVFGLPVADAVGGISRPVWLIFLTTLVAPLSVVVAKNLVDRDRWAGFAGPGALLGGVALLTVVTDATAISGPSPWFDWQYVTSSHSQTAANAGLYPAIVGSVFVIVLVALITLLFGIGAALYLEEYAPDTGVGGAIARFIRINISNLAGVPSVVYGMLGLAVFANLLGFGIGTVLTAAFTLSLLILPIVIISAREAISSVPDSTRKAAYGMGSTRWQTVRNVVLPRAIPGTLTGTILALGRAIGETAPLIMIGVPHTMFSPGTELLGKTTAMPMQVYVWSSYPSTEFQHGVVAAGVVTLLVVLLTMNSIAILLRNKFEKPDR